MGNNGGWARDLLSMCGKQEVREARIGRRSSSFSVVVRNGRISDILRIYMDELLMVPFLYLPVWKRGGGSTHIPVASSLLFLTSKGRMNIILGSAFSSQNRSSSPLHVLGRYSGVYYVNIL